MDEEKSNMRRKVEKCQEIRKKWVEGGERLGENVEDGGGWRDKDKVIERRKKKF